METMEDIAANYFSSMSHLANKMMQFNESVKDIYGDSWNGLSWDKQEELLDKHFLDPKIVDKYKSLERPEEPPSCFPVLKINSGEKIIVDFEHEDGWTWTDEHSAPFSWKTKSQQDLTLIDKDDSGNSKEEMGKKSRMGKKTRSPDRSMFDSANSGSKNEVEKMFEKFGIKVAGDSDDETTKQPVTSSAEIITKDPDSTVSPSHLYNEHSKLLGDSSDGRDGKDIMVETSAGIFSNSQDSQRGLKKHSNSAGKSSKAKETKNKSQSGAKREKDKGNLEKGKALKEKPSKKKTSSALVDQTIVGQSSSSDKIAFDTKVSSREEEFDVLPRASFSKSNISETIMPMRFAEIGESSTDDLCDNVADSAANYAFEMESKNFGYSGDAFDFGNTKTEDVVITSQPQKLELDAPLAGQMDEMNNESVIKTGFDFLDNW